MQKELEEKESRKGAEGKKLFRKGGREAVREDKVRDERISSHQFPLQRESLYALKGSITRGRQI